MVANEREGYRWFHARMAWQLARELVAIRQESAGGIHVQFWQASFQPFFYSQGTAHSNGVED
eukprot:1438352-Amphidinium_carterae.1